MNETEDYVWRNSILRNTQKFCKLVGEKELALTPDERKAIKVIAKLVWGYQRIKKPLAWDLA